MRNRILTLLGGGDLLALLRSRKRLKLRFAVNQAAAQSHGVDCDKAIVTLEIHPAQLSPTQRRLLDQRLLGIHVCEGVLCADGSRGPRSDWDRDTCLRSSRDPAPVLLVAELPTLEGLLKAVIRDERRLLDTANLRGTQELSSPAP